MKFSEDIVALLEERFPDKDIYSMSVDELKKMKEDVEQIKQEYFSLEMAFKTLGNAAYGASANRFFYFYNVALAGDITGECRNLTKTMWSKLEQFFHEDLWNMKDVQEQFGFELDESKHDWYRKQPVSIYSDTDSVYTTYGTLFQVMTPESQAKFDTDKKKCDFILKFNKEFVDKQNNRWCEEMYGPRHGKNVHEFELETISKAGIYLKKKKYLKGLSFKKGVFYEDPKVDGTGIDLIKSTTPKLCRKILKDITQSLMFDFDNSSEESIESYIFFFNEKLNYWREIFFQAPVEDISQSVGIGAYKKFVIDDEENLIFNTHIPPSVHAIARYNHLAYKNGEADKKEYSGKIKYYNIKIREGKQIKSGFFGFPAGKLPSWAPNIDRYTQWEKTVITPINSFLEVMNVPLADKLSGKQLSLF
jgi:hypothetical protein